MFEKYNFIVFCLGLFCAFYPKDGEAARKERKQRKDSDTCSVASSPEYTTIHGKKDACPLLQTLRGKEISALLKTPKLQKWSKKIVAPADCGKKYKIEITNNTKIPYKTRTIISSGEDFFADVTAAGYKPGLGKLENFWICLREIDAFPKKTIREQDGSLILDAFFSGRDFVADEKLTLIWWMKAKIQKIFCDQYTLLGLEIPKKTYAPLKPMPLLFPLHKDSFSHVSWDYGAYFFPEPGIEEVFHKQCAIEISDPFLVHDEENKDPSAAWDGPGKSPDRYICVDVMNSKHKIGRVFVYKDAADH